MDNVVELKVVSGADHKEKLTALFNSALTISGELERLVATVDAEYKAMPPHLHGCQMHAEAEERVVDFETAYMAANDLVDQLAGLAFKKET